MQPPMVNNTPLVRFLKRFFCYGFLGYKSFQNRCIASNSDLPGASPALNKSKA